MTTKIVEHQDLPVKAGLKQEQAKAILTIVSESDAGDVTKRDLNSLEYRLKVYVLQTIVAQTAIFLAALVAMVKL